MTTLAIVLAGLVAAASAAGATAPAATPGQGRGGVGDAYSVMVGPVVLPPTAACRRSGGLRVRLHRVDGRRPVLTRVLVAGHRVHLDPRRVGHAGLLLPIPRRGRFSVSVTVRVGHGRAARSFTVHGRYHGCAAA